MNVKPLYDSYLTSFIKETHYSGSFKGRNYFKFDLNLGHISYDFESVLLSTIKDECLLRLFEELIYEFLVYQAQKGK